MQVSVAVYTFVASIFAIFLLWGTKNLGLLGLLSSFSVGMIAYSFSDSLEIGVASIIFAGILIKFLYPYIQRKWVENYTNYTVEDVQKIIKDSQDNFNGSNARGLAPQIDGFQNELGVGGAATRPRLANGNAPTGARAAGTAAGMGVGAGTGAGMGAGTGAAAGMGVGAGTGAAAGMGMGAGTGAGMGAGAGTGAAAGMGAGTGAAAGMGAGTGAAAGMRAGATAGMGAGMGTGAAAGMGAGMGTGAATGMGTGAAAGMGTGAAAGMGAGMGTGAAAGMGAGNAMPGTASAMLNTASPAMANVNMAAANNADMASPAANGSTVIMPSVNRSGGTAVETNQRMQATDMSSVQAAAPATASEPASVTNMPQQQDIMNASGSPAGATSESTPEISPFANMETNGMFKLGQLPSNANNGPHIDAGTTIMRALGALNTDQIGSLTTDTRKLLDTQKSLMNMLTTMKPMLSDGQNLLASFTNMFGKQ